MKTFQIFSFAVVLLLCSALSAETVVDIVFEGNRVTRESVMLREMALQKGDRFDEALMADSRQAILDLGLFRQVEVSRRDVEGGVIVAVKVREKHFLLPIPRLDASVDRDYAYGLQLYWNNIAGRNHSLSAYVQQAQFSEDRAAEQDRGVRFAYTAPFAFDTPFELRTTLERIEQVTVRDERGFDEQFDRVQFLVGRDFSEGRPRRGWNLGGGLYWQQQKSSGVFAPPSDGSTTALVALAEFNDVRFDVYSETGRRFRSRLEHAPGGLRSDYEYSQLSIKHEEFIAIGQRAHQRLHLTFEGGWHEGPPDTRNPFSLGGSSRLRGYPAEFIEGRRYAFTSVEFLRPIHRDWLRLVLAADAGWTDGDVFGQSPSGLFASVGVGLRVRLTWFVNVELELGVAAPLRGGEGARAFGGGG